MTKPDNSRGSRTLSCELYARTMALPIRFGPKKLGGAGFIQLETIQGEGQILNVLKHWRSEGKISDLLRCAVAWGQFQAGTGQPILSAPEKCIPYFAQRYLKSVRNFLASIGGKIELDTSFVPELQRTNDFYLMDHALWCNKFNAKQLEMVNNCRLYLQVVTAADIVLPNGTDIDEWMRQGTLHPDSSSTRYVKIEQARPNQKAWMQWKVLCASIKQEFYLKPLGQWLLPASKLRRHWPAYYDLKRKWLYVHSSDGYMQYAVNQNRDFDHGLLCPEWVPTIIQCLFKLKLPEEGCTLLILRMCLRSQLAIHQVWRRHSRNISMICLSGIGPYFNGWNF